jgi:2-polyprenyl-6-methoxyphenol hydroxylase-like FAD-dependent oxidoreductase
MTDMAMDARVAIVGAGPAGALLAYLLASRGIETILVERQSDFAREFRGEVLMPSGLHALDEAGITLEGIAHRTSDRLEGFLNRRRFLDLDTSAFGPRPPTAVSQPELLERMVSLADSTGAFELHRGRSVRGVAREDDGSISLRLAGRGEDGETTLRVPFVVGADGRSSVVRRALAHPVRRRSTPLDVVWFKVPHPAAWSDARFRFEAGNGHLLIALRAPDDRLQVAWVILKGTFGQLRSRGIEEWVDAMCEHADPELAAHLAREKERLTRPFLLDAVTDRVVGWSERGLLVIGDAAHTMSPVGAQGLNLALRDAIVAANLLVPAFRGEERLDEAAERVEALRAREIDRIQQLAAIPPRVVMGRTRLHAFLRRQIARAAGTRAAAAIARRVGSDFLDGVTDVRLSV